MLRVGEIVIPREEHTKWLSNAKWSVLKTHTSNIVHTEQVILRNTYANTYMYVTTIN